MSDPIVSTRTKLIRAIPPVVVFLVVVGTAVYPDWNPWVIEHLMKPLGERPRLLLLVLGFLICGWWTRETLLGAKVANLKALNSHLENRLSAPHVDDQHCFDLLLPQIAPETGQLSWLDLGKFSGRSWSKLDLDKIKDLLDDNRLLTFRDKDLQKAYETLRDSLRAFISGLGDHAGPHLLFPNQGDLRTSIKYDEFTDSVAEELHELSNTVLRARDDFIAIGKAKNFSLAALHAGARAPRDGASN
ncbi:hypothetical protein [Rhodococcus sp. JT-3]|uniref:hypothetical protein n=1 Tax=Rhodococcus sp. JT-3 TaxID=1973213 RepID=UPI001303240D|nr:hypothetical protein [Rhodococcus sp. JT-3]